MGAADGRAAIDRRCRDDSMPLSRQHPQRVRPIAKPVTLFTVLVFTCGASQVLPTAAPAVQECRQTGRRGVELPKVRDTYWPHRKNFERLNTSPIDWRLLCPGPMVDQAALGIDRLRIAADQLPVAVPSFAGKLPSPLLLLLFASKVPQMIVPYADAAALMLAHLAPRDAMSRHRVGLALPVGMRGKKDTWAAKPRSAS